MYIFHIKAIHPAGYPVEIETDEDINDTIAKLQQRGYRPDHSNGDGWQRTPTGEPICPKHGAVMSKREKQGDEWYSHKVTDPASGADCYCRGYPDKNGPGWFVAQPGRPPSPTQAPAVRQQLPNVAHAPRPQNYQSKKADDNHPDSGSFYALATQALLKGRIANDVIASIEQQVSHYGWGWATSELQQQLKQLQPA